MSRLFHRTPHPAPVLPARLVAAHEHVREELKRADNKATTLLSLVGAALAGIVALTGRPVDPAAAIALWTSAAPILASVVLLIVAIHPRLTRHPVPGTWLHAATSAPAAVLDACQSDPDPAGSLARDLCVLGRVTRGKYRNIQAAVMLLVVGLVVLALALVLAVIA
jgi:hypothetical protein